ncbi:MAG: cell division protein ZipA C-terminal FtsZ-binding domain-containing protein [Candidatus Azotimanducaceae bacterium]
MEFDLRQWLLIIGPLLVLGVILHGYYRMRLSSNDLKMNLDKSFLNREYIYEEDEERELASTELPNGGARVIGESSAPNELAEMGHKRDSRTEEMSQEYNSSKDAEDIRDIIVLNVLTDSERIKGQELLEFLMENEMSYGEMEIFHKLDNQGEVLFSLANAIEPGTFDLSDIEEFEIQGVTLFMQIDGANQAERIFDDMLELARKISGKFSSQIFDGTRSALTQQTIGHIRQNIREMKFKEMA